MTAGVSPTAVRLGLATAWGLGLAALVWLTGCSGGEVERATADGATLEIPAVEVSTVEVPCSIAIDEVDDVGPTYFAHGLNGGFVALPSEGWWPSRALQWGRMGPAGSEFEGFRFSKFGLLVRRDRAVSVEVVNAPGRAVLEYVHPDVPARKLSVGPCPSEHGEWVVFAGGVWVTEAGCVELVAASGDERLRVRLAVASVCDGAP